MNTVYLVIGIYGEYREDKFTNIELVTNSLKAAREKARETTKEIPTNDYPLNEGYVYIESWNPVTGEKNNDNIKF